VTAPKGTDPDIALITENLSGVKHRILVLSGKGGVGKSTVTAQLARLLAQDEDKQVGVLDVDICGPSQPQMLGVTDESLHVSQLGLSPVISGENGNLSIVSVGFLLKDEFDAVIWRGPKKNALIKRFLRDVRWESLDYLLIDTPPGTSDEHLALAQLIAPITGAIVVTTPQEVAWQDARKELDFCRKTNIRILGIVENMAGFICPHCRESSEIFEGSAVRKYAEKNGIQMLACIPIDPRVGMACDGGEIIPAGSLAAQHYEELARNVLSQLDQL
jgi:Mrp family chromosome partitioning ATPase